MMQVTLNGAPQAFAEPLSIEALLLTLNLRKELVAIELNRQIVRRTDYGKHVLCEGDALEIVEFVGGG